MNKVVAIIAAVFAVLTGCASQPPPAEALQSSAVSAAQQRGAAELDCAAASAQILSKQTIQEATGTGWSEYPHRAAYTVDVSGCGKHTTYAVECDVHKHSCVAGPLAVSTPPRQLADKLQPGAVIAAQRRGMSDLGCEAVTSEILRQETIQEVTGTGWSEYPHRAAYTVDVSGCGKRTAYLVSCDDRKQGCVAAGVQKKTEGGPPQLADKLQPDAVRVAQQQGVGDLACPAATTEVLKQETIEEVQTTGWYEPPYRAIYSIRVSGCGKRASYLVACDARKKRCGMGSTQAERE